MKINTKIRKRIENFKQDLSAMSIPTLVRKHITFGDSYVFENAKYFELRAEVSEHFDIHPSEVLLVGSGKLGFSIAQTV